MLEPIAVQGRDENEGGPYSVLGCDVVAVAATWGAHNARCEGESAGAGATWAEFVPCFFIARFLKFHVHPNREPVWR